MNDEEKQTKKAQEDQAAKKTTGVAAKGAIDYFTAGQGGKIYDKAKKLPGVGKKLDQVEDKVGKTLNKATGGSLGKVAKKADDIGALDAADKALSLKIGKSNNFGKQNLNNNIGIAPPSTNSLDAKKAKNENRLQEQLQNNELRAIDKAISQEPASEAITDTSSKLASKNKKTPNNSSKDQPEEEKNDDKVPFSLNGTISFTKILPLILPLMGVMLIIIIIISTISGVVNQFEELFGIGSGGNMPDIEGVSRGDPQVEAFYNRILNVQREYAASGKNFSADLIAAVYHILNSRSKFNYTQMTDGLIREIANYMFVENCTDDGCTYSYSEDTFKNNLTNVFFPKYLKTDECALATEEVFTYLKEYKELIGNSGAAGPGGGGVCTYEVPGVVISGNVRNVNLIIDNLMYRPLQTPLYGGVSGGVLDNGTLVQFEKYALGVTLGEYHDTGPIEGAKAQAVAARSYAISRSFDMGNIGGRMLGQENGQWILALLNSVQDQVYCDPDQGCSRDVPGDQQNTQVYSGTTAAPYKYKDPLAADDPLRLAVGETNGIVLTDNNDNIIYTGYVQSTQTEYARLARSGLDYVAILLSIYSKSGATKIKQMNCTGPSASSGGYSSWKQTDPNWANTKLGNGTIGKIGCLATSIAMQIAKSKTNTNVNGEFNPGSFVQSMSASGGFDAAGNLQWNAVTKVAPNFKYVNRVNLRGKSKEEKLRILTNLQNQGYYLVCEVKGDTGQHWVAIDNINNQTITMMDPGSNATNMWSQYDWTNTSAVSYFQAS